MYLIFMLSDLLACHMFHLLASLLCCTYEEQSCHRYFSGGALMVMEHEQSFIEDNLQFCAIVVI